MIELVKRLAGPERPFDDAETGKIAVEGDRVGRVGLQLDGIGAGLLGRPDDLDCLIETLIVIARHLGDDVGGVTGTDLSSADRNSRRRAYGFYSHVSALRSGEFPAGRQHVVPGEPPFGASGNQPERCFGTDVE